MEGAYIILLLAGLGLMLIISRGPKRGKSRNYGKTNKVSSSAIRQQWHEVEQMVAGGRPSSFKAAIMEADKLLAAALETKGFSGDFVGKMKKAKNKFSNPDGVWFAHKMRNRMVHEVGHDLFASEAKKALAEYKRALKDLGIL